MNFSIIIPWKGGNAVREAHLRNMLMCLTKQEITFPYEIIIVEQVPTGLVANPLTRVLEILPADLATITRYIPLVYNGPFNKSWCMNVGARESQYNNLVFADADSLFGSNFLADIMQKIGVTQDPHKYFFSCWDYVICMPGKDNPVVRYMKNDDIRTMGAIWYAEKNFYFNQFGGMNENFIGYGGEDNEAYSRAVSILNCASIVMMNYSIVHQYHDWEAYNINGSIIFDACMVDPKETIRRLKEVGVGKKESPSTINIDDFLLRIKK